MAGRRVGGRYLLERRIGEGGMAEVLLARDEERGGSPVVLKRCRAHLAHQPEMATLFLREARLASLIHHPNVVELEATGDDDGQPYLVMEYLQGFTLREIFIRSNLTGGVPQDLAALIILGAARGLHAAHTACDENGQPMGLMHRDVSPHNLFVTETGIVKVLDFGIAKGVNELTMTRAGHVKGKASYLAPEQLDPHADIDARADLFSLGTVAWELFTGKRLFRRATETDTVMAIRALKVERPDRERPEIDVAYADVVMRLLARHPEKRPSTAEDVAQALEATLRIRAPHMTTGGGGGELAKFVAQVKEIDPTDASRVSLAPGIPAARKAARLETKPKIEKPAPVAAIPRPPKPKPPEEMTATVAPPAASWVDLSGQPAPMDGSVVGMFAVAGATAPPSVDMSGGYASIDPNDLELEASKAERLPHGALANVFDEDEAETQAVLPRVDLPAEPARTRPRAPSGPPPRISPLSPFHTETKRVRTPSKVDVVVQEIDRHVGVVVRLVESRLGKRPTPGVVAAIMVGALLTGLTVAFAITSLFQ